MSTISIAIPLAEGRLTAHFGHCASFAFVLADRASGEIKEITERVPPPHEPGVLPRWIGEQGASVVIAGGMGGRAQDLFRQQSITVITGAPCEEPALLVQKYLGGSLETGANACDH